MGAPSTSSRPAIDGAARGPAAALRRGSIWLAATATAIGVTVLAGWVLGFDIEETGIPGVLTMRAPTAVCLVLAGSALWLAGPDPGAAQRRRAARALACAAALLGLATLAEYLFDVDLGIDLLLFRNEAIREGGVHPGRMPLHAAVAFMLVGAAIVLLDVETRRGRRPSEILACAVCVTTWLAFVGYVLGVPVLYGTGAFTEMPVHTAAGLLMLGVGVLLARPSRGAMAVVAADNFGGFLARRLKAYLK